MRYIKLIINNYLTLITLLFTGFIIFFFSNKEIFNDITFFSRIYYHTSGIPQVIIISLAVFINIVISMYPLLKEQVKNASLTAKNNELKTNNAKQLKDLAKINIFLSEKTRNILLEIHKRYGLESKERVTLYVRIPPNRNGMIILDRHSENIHYAKYDREKTYKDANGIIGRVMENGFHIDDKSPECKRQSNKSEREKYIKYHKKHYNITEEDINDLTESKNFSLPCRFVAKSLKDKNGVSCAIVMLEGFETDSLTNILENENLLNSLEQFSGYDNLILSLVEIKKELHKYNFITEIEQQNANQPTIE